MNYKHVKEIAGIYAKGLNNEITVAEVDEEIEKVIEKAQLEVLEEIYPGDKNQFRLRVEGKIRELKQKQ